MADGDAEPQHPYKKFRGDYGQSDDEQQSNPSDDENEPVNKHRSPQQPTYYLPDSTVQHPLCFPDNGTGDDDTGSETSVIVKPSAGGL